MTIRHYFLFSFFLLAPYFSTASAAASSSGGTLGARVGLSATPFSGDSKITHLTYSPTHRSVSLETIACWTEKLEIGEFVVAPRLLRNDVVYLKVPMREWDFTQYAFPTLYLIQVFGSSFVVHPRMPLGHLAGWPMQVDSAPDVWLGLNKVEAFRTRPCPSSAVDEMLYRRQTSLYRTFRSLAKPLPVPLNIVRISKCVPQSVIGQSVFRWRGSFRPQA